MIQAIVAEDKHPILRNLVVKLERSSNLVQVIGEATDGLSALELCQQLKPHILFTDIRMPGLDGLALIRALKQACPDMIFVIISGYDDFGYAREALRLGVKEFLLKPVTQQAMDATLSNIMELVQERAEVKEQQWIYDLLRGRQVSPEITKSLSEAHAYSIMIVCAGSLSTFHLDLIHPLHDIWFRFDMERFLASQPHIRYQDRWIFEGDAMNELIVVFRHPPDDSFPAHELFRSLQQELQAYHVESFTCAISNRVEHVSNLKLEYQLTRMILNNQAVFDSTQLIHICDYSIHSTSQEDPEKYYNRQKLISYIKNNNKEPFLQEMRLTIELWQQARFTQASIELCLSTIVQCAFQAYYHQSTVSPEIRLELHEIMMISRNYNSLYRNMVYLFERFFPAPTSTQEATLTIKHAIEKLERYFQDHLAEELTIAELADMVKFNVSFLSREFKKVKGVSPIEYLTQLRIEKAKQLILEPSNHKFKDVGSMVGYSNPYYFSKVFKLITGVTPSEYKQYATSSHTS